MTMQANPEALEADAEAVMAIFHDYLDDCPDSVWEEMSVRVYEALAMREHDAPDVEAMRRVAIKLAASLAATISLLEKGGKAAKKAAPSDRMFDQMLVDYRQSLDDARRAIGGIP